MGDFRIEINGTGNHGCQREVKDGEIKAESCGEPSCVDCIAADTVKRLKNSGAASITSATLMHWPAAGPHIVDDLTSRKRTGSFK